MHKCNEKPGKVIILVLLSGILLLGGGTVAMAGIDGLSSAINKAGRQRMLTQRIAKAYTLVAMEVMPRQYRKQLDDAVALFESQLAELKAFAPTEQIAAGLAEVERLWGPYKAVATGPAARDGARTLLETNDELLVAAHEVVLLLQKEAGTSVGRLVNISGRQRMLSQRFAKFYVQRAWGFDHPTVMQGMETSGREFEDALSILKSAPENTPAIQDELLKAGKQWHVVKRGLDLASDGKYVPMIVGHTTEQLLKIMDRITGMYEQLSRR